MEITGRGHLELLWSGSSCKWRNGNCENESEEKEARHGEGRKRSAMASSAAVSLVKFAGFGQARGVWRLGCNSPPSPFERMASKVEDSGISNPEALFDGSTDGPSDKVPSPLRRPRSTAL